MRRFKDFYWDFPFIVMYSTAIMLVCGKAATLTSGRWSKYLVALAWTMVVAGSHVVVENFEMLSMLSVGHVESGFVPLVTTVSAGIKFLLIGLGLLGAMPTYVIALTLGLSNNGTTEG